MLNNNHDHDYDYDKKPRHRHCYIVIVPQGVLPKENRLQKTRDFDLVFKKGRFFGTKFFGLKYMENGLAHTRVGFVVSTKISKSAVKRNRLKRQMREIFRLNLDKIKPGIDISVITKPGAAGMEYGEIERDLLFALKKVGLFK